jgi:hypothetical protein
MAGYCGRDAVTMDNATEAIHIQRIHALVHGEGYRSPQLYRCASCHKLYQLAERPGTPVVRMHLIRNMNELCPGALHRPLTPPASERAIHWMPPMLSYLPCCDRPAKDVPAFDTFTPLSVLSTCGGPPKAGTTT